MKGCSYTICTVYCVQYYYIYICRSHLLMELVSQMLTPL